MTHIDKRLDLARENIAAGIMKIFLWKATLNIVTYLSRLLYLREDVCTHSVDSSNREKELQVHIPWQCTLPC